MHVAPSGILSRRGPRLERGHPEKNTRPLDTPGVQILGRATHTHARSCIGVWFVGRVSANGASAVLTQTVDYAGTMEHVATSQRHVCQGLRQRIETDCASVVVLRLIL